MYRASDGNYYSHKETRAEYNRRRYGTATYGTPTYGTPTHPLTYAFAGIGVFLLICMAVALFVN